MWLLQGYVQQVLKLQEG